MTVALPPLTALQGSADRGACLLAGRLADALRAGDTDDAERVVRHALGAGLSPECVQSLVIGPALGRVGELCSLGALTAEDCHVATMITRRALRLPAERLHRDAFASGTGRRVLLAAPEGQRHVLGLRMVADVLEAHRFTVRDAGGDVGPAALREAVEAFAPDVVGIGFGLAGDLAPLAEAIATVHETRPSARVMLGGRAVPPGLWNLGYPRVTSTVGLVDTVEQLLEGPAQALPEEVRRLRPLPPLALAA